MKTIFAFLVLISGLVVVHAKSDSPSNADQINALRQTIDDAYNLYYSTNDESGNLYKELEKLQKTYPPKMFLLAQKEPASQAACHAFVWIAMKGWDEDGPSLTNRFQSLAYLAEYHSTNSKVGPLCSNLGRFWNWRWHDIPVVDFLETIAKNNPDRAIRGQAIFALGQLFSSKSREIANFENWGRYSFFTNGFSADYLIAVAQSGSSQSAAEEAEKRLKEVIENYADCTDLRELRNQKKEAPKLRELASECLFDLLNLSLGRTAPEIEAEDLDGKKFKLSDYRGKICVLSFWASWCGSCMQMVPVERALFERLHGKSFALVGVNGDAILADAKRATTKEKMAWPSFWNGKGGPKGPISEAWNIHGWPTIFVLDANGVIRLKTGGYGPNSSNELNGSVNELMKTVVSKK